jgi:hypothetical protein
MFGSVHIVVPHGTIPVPGVAPGGMIDAASKVPPLLLLPPLLPVPVPLLLPLMPLLLPPGDDESLPASGLLVVPPPQAAATMQAPSEIKEKLRFIFMIIPPTTWTRSRNARPQHTRWPIWSALLEGEMSRASLSGSDVGPTSGGRARSV